MSKATKVTHSKPDFENLLKNLCASENTPQDALGVSYASIWDYDNNDKYNLKESFSVRQIALLHHILKTIHENQYKFHKDNFLKNNSPT